MHIGHPTVPGRRRAVTLGVIVLALALSASVAASTAAAEVTWSPATWPAVSTEESVGARLAASGDTLAVGLPRQTVQGQPEAGAIHVQRRRSDGTVASYEIHTPDGVTAHERFGGQPLRTAGDLLVTWRHTKLLMSWQLTDTGGTFLGFTEVDDFLEDFAVGDGILALTFRGRIEIRTAQPDGSWRSFEHAPPEALQGFGDEVVVVGDEVVVLDDWADEVWSYEPVGGSWQAQRLPLPDDRWDGIASDGRSVVATAGTRVVRLHPLPGGGWSQETVHAGTQHLGRRVSVYGDRVVHLDFDGIDVSTRSADGVWTTVAAPEELTSGSEYEVLALADRAMVSTSQGIHSGRWAGVPGYTYFDATAQGAGRGEIDVTWNGAEHDWMAPPTGYRIRLSDGQTIDVGPGVRQWRLTGLRDDTAYAVVVTAVNGEGESLPLEPVEAMTHALPGAVEDLEVQRGLANVTVSWSRPTDTGRTPIIAYELLRDGEPLVVVPGSATSYSDEPVAYTHTHTYTVRPVNVVGDGPDASVCDEGALAGVGGIPECDGA